MNLILKSIKPVIRKSEHVRINKQKIVEFCEKFDHKDVRHWMDDMPYNISKLNNYDKLNFLLVFNCNSFCYWGNPKWTISYKGKEFDGAWGMLASIGKAVDNKKPILYPRYLAKISEEDFGKILEGNCEIPLFQERLKILREIGQVLNKKYEGEFRNLVRAAKGDVVKLVKLIVKEFPSFNDYAIYKGKKVYFYKRAQLLVGDIYQSFKGKEYGNLKNIKSLTACADYKLPQMLRKFGILEYSKDLAEKVDKKIQIKKGSEEEVEIRANTIWAIELIKKELKKDFPSIDSVHVNDHLWLLSQTKNPKDKPYHLTKTIFY